MTLGLVTAVLALVMLAGCAVVANRFHVPPEVEPARVTRAQAPLATPSGDLRIMTWNIGYAGMGQESDFVMDKGKQLRPLSAGLVDRNLVAIADRLRASDADVILIQEGATPSWNTWRRDVIGQVSAALPAFDSMFGADVDTRFVPAPFNVQVGNAIFARQGITTAEWRGLPLEPTFQWGIFRKSYRMHVARLGGQDGWVIINLHLSTFDTKTDNVREKQVIEVLRFASAEYAKGAHVVIGGDWNLRLSPTEFPHRTAEAFLFWIRDFPQHLVPEGWTWAVDDTAPTVRTAHQPYRAGDNYTLTIDGFLVSPNVAVKSVTTTETGFVHTDHNPVSAAFRQR